MFLWATPFTKLWFYDMKLSDEFVKRFLIRFSLYIFPDANLNLDSESSFADVPFIQ